ncbi:hypothetical protein RKJ46_05355 [Klebsiella pneumoniae]|nr:hypothetical protein [Klebsiella pneumoniae]
MVIELTAASDFKKVHYAVIPNPGVKRPQMRALESGDSLPGST